MADPHAGSLAPEEGWHVLHLYYRVCQEALERLGAERRARGREELVAILEAPGRGADAGEARLVQEAGLVEGATPQGASEVALGARDLHSAVERVQVMAVSGQKADLGILLMGPDPLALDAVQQRVRSCALGPALVPVYSFTSITEVSEYVPTVEQYAARLRAEGEDPASDSYRAKLRTYEAREEKMRAQRLYPEIPPWPAMCFYPMNKSRVPGANWFTLAFSERMRLMTEHGRTGMTFAGNVTQLITASTGLDDWEWGVTLWARNPQFLKEIVYRMRFDEASARYAQFGPFYVGYVMEAPKLVEHLRL